MPRTNNGVAGVCPNGGAGNEVYKMIIREDYNDRTFIITEATDPDITLFYLFEWIVNHIDNISCYDSCELTHRIHSDLSYLITICKYEKDYKFAYLSEMDIDELNTFGILEVKF